MRREDTLDLETKICADAQTKKKVDMVHKPPSEDYTDNQPLPPVSHIDVYISIFQGCLTEWGVKQLMLEDKV